MMTPINLLSYVMYLGYFTLALVQWENIALALMTLACLVYHVTLLGAYGLLYRLRDQTQESLHHATTFRNELLQAQEIIREQALYIQTLSPTTATTKKE